MSTEERVRAIFARYVAKYPNELANIADEGHGGNHWRILLSWVISTYALETGIHENQMRFERPVVRKIVEDVLREHVRK